MLNHIEITWYGYVIAGFCIGVYIHSHRIRHYLHWLAIKVLQGFIWLLQRTDLCYKKPKAVKPEPKPAQIIPIKNTRQDGIEVGEDELKELLEKNPD